jgi:hypothetical protein
MSGAEFDLLTKQFAADPKESLAWARESLMDIAANVTKMPDRAKRSERFDRYLDAYIGLTVRLDNLAFPSASRVVHSGVPQDYIPDGFVDMGREQHIDPTARSREQIVVDKKEILEKYKPLLKQVLGRDYGNVPLGTKKHQMADAIALGVYSQFPYSKDAADGYLGSDTVRLASLDEGVCRHQGLVFQVLLQAAGIKSRPLKAKYDGLYHMTNLVRIDDEWFLYDVTNPDYIRRRDGIKEWRPGKFEVNGLPRAGEGRHYYTRGLYSGDVHIYETHDKMHWRIGRIRR